MNTWITPEVIAMKREALESIYHHRMTVYVTKTEYDPQTGFYEPKEKEIYSNIPCRASTQMVEPTQDLPYEFSKKMRVHCAPELEIPEGSKIKLTFYHGKEESFWHVSARRIHSDHQVLLMREYDEKDLNYA